MATGTTIQVTLPAMGESVTEGTVLEWHKAEGDTIAADETLVEISTDKVDAEVPAPAAGTVAKIHFAEGDTVEVGAVLAEIATENGASASASTSEPEAATPASEAAEDDSTNGAAQIIDIVTPGAGESVTEGTVLEWLKQVGDSVQADESVVEISTDKVDMELPAPASGTITEILADEGATVTVGQTIARMKVGPGAKKAETNGGAATESAPAPATPISKDVKATPVAQRAAAVEGVDLSTVQGSGPHGRITKDDVLNAGNGAPAAAPAGAEAKLIKGGAAMLARYMDESRSIPTATSFRTITVTAMDGRRKELKNAGEKVSFTHLIAYAIALAVQQDMPVMAHTFEQRDGKPYRIDAGAVNLGIAVDVTNKKGGDQVIDTLTDSALSSHGPFACAT